MAIRYGWIRALLFLLVYLMVWLALSLLPVNFYLLYTIGSLAGVALVFAFTRWLDGRPLSGAGLQWNGYEAQPVIGCCIAISMLGTATLFLVANGQLQWMAAEWTGDSFFLSLGLMIMVAITEELAFRGYVLRNLMLSLPAPAALLVSALLFALFHAGNPNAGWLPLVNIFIAGLLLGINFLYTQNCWFGIGLHFAWNFFQGPVLGFAVSGMEQQSILSPSMGHDQLLTGGAFGLEGSLLATILELVALIVLYIIYQNDNSRPGTGAAAKKIYRI
ncbi:CPBP family intramembrane glutamic endopeptidase [Flavihumibacter petaseus]|uniref:CAAX prenyl protease 2/Lysostaphin resistance protein A-like domain-containing protein n=1 Tax=Flavihumibacter petaseus NBRC 106054 TaxID=1220578 RepID=A0A0E9N6R3_9BACT|nr:type II CAAX endopeptidase family protein [Flavihumibacter petaseus]GAO45514.1 hypothetical protein FPE01S_06_00050 [Flavihumibacter petaseus NBRC 106054]